MSTTIFGDDQGDYRSVGFTSTSGATGFGYMFIPSLGNRPGMDWSAGEPVPLRDTPGWRTFWFGRQDLLGGQSWGAIIPHWLAAVLFATLPALRFISRWRRKRRLARVGLCASCGYDLRATPGRCPECGAESTQHEPAERPV